MITAQTCFASSLTLGKRITGRRHAQGIGVRNGIRLVEALRHAERVSASGLPTLQAPPQRDGGCNTFRMTMQRKRHRP
jgi:hypothetical protein